MKPRVLTLVFKKIPSLIALLIPYDSQLESSYLERNAERITKRSNSQDRVPKCNFKELIQHTLLEKNQSIC